MRSSARGKTTSDVEITNVSKHGFWLLVRGEELFAAFESFPWFKEAPVGQILNVEMPSAHHLYWPDLDVDLAVESLRNPDAFPLVSGVSRNEAQQPSSRQGKVKPKRARSRAAHG
ncbi:MAG: DUF2442 domain-containing protein [Proteobacteria bacterium]|nr:DUF2442 domain-containing protein [Pseudomonadota bacterium]